MPTRIFTLEQLQDCALQRKAVVAPSLPYMRKPRPAAFVINFQGPQLVRLFRAGLFVYEAPKKEGGKG